MIQVTVYYTVYRDYIDKGDVHGAFIIDLRKIEKFFLNSSSRMLD